MKLFSYLMAASILLIGINKTFADEIPNQNTPLDQKTIIETKPPLGELVFGNENAKTTVVEYMSMTCSHCAYFYNMQWPNIKSNYIDNGKVKWIVRDMSMSDPFTIAETMFFHCIDKKDQEKLMVDFFNIQQELASSDKPVDILKTTVLKYGLTPDKAEECLKNSDTFNAIAESRKKGIEFGVKGTPTFFIAGELITGTIPVESMHEKLNAAIEKSPN